MKFKKGDKVVMHAGVRATLACNQYKVFECDSDSFFSHGDEVVFLKDHTGYFCCEFLKAEKH